MINKLEVDKLKGNVYSVYDYNGLSMQELLSEFFNKINETVALSNEAKSIADYIKNEGLVLEVGNKIQEMFINGKLEDIININIFENLNNKINYLIPSSLTNLQETLTNVINGNSLILNGSYVGETFTIENKENITIIGSATLKQQIEGNLKPSYENPTSNKALLKIVNCKNIKIIGLNFLNKYEAIDILSSENVIVDSCKIDGNNNTSTFNASVVRDSKNVTFSKCNIINCGTMPTYNTLEKINVYSLGNGISGYLSSGITVVDCKVICCGQNGVYTYACNNVTVKNNYIENNGMSGIQFAFAFGTEKGYIVDGNTIINNYSDGLDINNTIAQNINIDCIISNNIYENNGWFNKDKNKITQDGSGIATLVNVSNVNGINNMVSDCCRTGLYISNCNNIDIKGKINKSKYGVGTLLYVGGCENVNVELNGEHYCVDDNAIAFDSTYKANKNVKIKNSNIFSDTMLCFYTKGTKKQENISIEDSIMRTRKSSNGIGNDISFNNVSFISEENFGATLSEGLTLKNCKITSLTSTGVYMENNTSFINCDINGGIACIVWGKNNVKFVNTIFRGSNNGIRIDGTNNTFLQGCNVIGISHGLHINGTSTVKVVDSILSSTGGANSLRAEQGGVVYTDNNVYNGSYDFTTATNKTIQWN